MTERFEEHRSHLRAVAYRMLGSVTEADDALQDAWIRINRADTSDVENLGGWLTTVVARVCLNMLRSRQSRREEPYDVHVPEQASDADPERDAVLADSVGLALLVVLETLTPAERLAFVLHDMFAVPFDEIAPMIDRTPAAARQLASRARRRVKGGQQVPEPDLARQREVVGAYLAASRDGDFDALVELLHPEVVLHADATVLNASGPIVVRGVDVVARRATTAAQLAHVSDMALVDGGIGIVTAFSNRLSVALTFTIAEGKITGIDVIGDPNRLAELEIGVLSD
ncbi:RNA polymerase sigma-70 factor (ECF subfamily) [Kibdelosporangium banguiense]|uniref:RNA polymerase sigma-70 factor (ECF subfamily) n=1 Tax=Kibdelosporangium banguiense TaxID=1365924 RepID=A0ABS4T7J0_9PSEU|nr:sigma-70 family RNA polymerase sigma factor [Kibdelosporangium banguiense]MBP2320353.1 RNA polymerase sigma-70 factor (ECF subfamily) [Kibdelosporangium banguiense]